MKSKYLILIASTLIVLIVSLLFHLGHYQFDAVLTQQLSFFSKAKSLIFFQHNYNSNFINVQIKINGHVYILNSRI